MRFQQVQSVTIHPGQALAGPVGEVTVERADRLAVHVVLHPGDRIINDGDKPITITWLGAPR